MDVEVIARRVREEFREMPGLRLTPAQATRLWGLERDTCQEVIDRLVAAAFLRWTAAGAVVTHTICPSCLDWAWTHPASPPADFVLPDRHVASDLYELREGGD